MSRGRSPAPFRPRASKGRSGPLGWIRAHLGAILAAFLAVVVIGIAYVAFTLRSAPDLAHEGLLGQTIVVYDVKNRVIEERNPKGQFYVALPLDQLGKYGPAATLASEDRHYYSE